MTFINLLAILFIGLKLADIIAWSWWLVLLPLYPAIIAIIIALIGLIGLVVANK